jgi:hypothetical protein
MTRGRADLRTSAQYAPTRSTPPLLFKEAIQNPNCNNNPQAPTNTTPRRRAVEARKADAHVAALADLRDELSTAALVGGKFQVCAARQMPGIGVKIGMALRV